MCSHMIIYEKMLLLLLIIIINVCLIETQIKERIGRYFCLLVFPLIMFLNREIPYHLFYSICSGTFHEKGIYSNGISQVLAYPDDGNLIFDDIRTIERQMYY